MTYNVCGLRDYRKVAALSHWVRCNRLSIVCLQETYLDNNDMAVLNRHFPSASVYLSPGSSHSCGVVTIVSDSLTSSLAYASPDGRLLSVMVSYDTLQLSVANVYSPNALVQRLAFFNDISKLLDDPIEQLVSHLRPPNTGNIYCVAISMKS